MRLPVQKEIHRFVHREEAIRISHRQGAWGKAVEGYRSPKRFALWSDLRRVRSTLKISGLRSDQEGPQRREPRLPEFRPNCISRLNPIKGGQTWMCRKELDNRQPSPCNRHTVISPLDEIRGSLKLKHLSGRTLNIDLDRWRYPQRISEIQ